MYKMTTTNGELTQRELDAARLGFVQLLRCKRFSPHFIDTNAEDLFGIATVEYSRKLAEGEEIENPAGWLITCAWRRTKSHLEAESRAPRVVSTEKSGPVVDEEGQGPEDILLSEDRFRKVREAVEGLSVDQRRILALSYFEGFTVREAGRRLRWHSSKAQRAHEGAKRRMHELLDVGSSDDLAIEIGLAAYLSVAVGTAGAKGRVPFVHDLLDRGSQKASEGIASLKQQASTAYTRVVDPTPLAAARPGTVASVVASCVLIGGGAATICAQEGVDPLGAARGLIASTSEPDSPPPSSEEPKAEEPQGPIYTPEESAPVTEEPAAAEQSNPSGQEAPKAESKPEPEPKEEAPPPPDDSFQPVSPPYMEPEESSESQSSEEAAPVESTSSPAPVRSAGTPGPQFGGP